LAVVLELEWSRLNVSSVRRPERCMESLRLESPLMIDLDMDVMFSSAGPRIFEARASERPNAFSPIRYPGTSKERTTDDELD
jgi:hypothetical protein